MMSYLLSSLIAGVGFAGLVTAVAAWSIWGGEMFPAEADPKGGKAVTLIASPSVILTNHRSINVGRFRVEAMAGSG